MQTGDAMADISLEFVGNQLQNIQAELREMKFAAEVERRNQHSAFSNLVTEVGIKLGTFEAMIEHRLGAMDGRLETMEDRLGTMDERLGMMEERLERLGTIDERLGMAVTGVEILHKKFDRIEQLLTSRGASS
jgi:archaellum component FlaC